MVYVLLADGFEEVEALTPVDMLRRAGLEVATVGIHGKTVMGAHGIAITADITADEWDETRQEMLVLPGGYPGYENLENSEFVQDAVDKTVVQGRWLAAICGAPSVLGHKGLLNGKTATCFPGMESELMGAILSEDEVCVDGNIITSRSAGTAMAFALKLVEVLTDAETARSLQNQIHFKG